jgi:hypothetical protein
MFKTKDQNTENMRTITTDTNMMVEFLANSEKLKGEGDRVFFSKDIDSDNNKYDLDDDIDSYTKPRANNKYSEHKRASIDESTADNATDHKKSSEHTDTHYNRGGSSDEPEEKKLTKEEENMRKFDMLLKLGELTQLGITISDNYNMKSDYETMKHEYEMHTNLRSKRNAVNWMSGMMIGIIKGVELMNDQLNPFDIKFEDAWSNNVRTDITNYYDVLGEIYDKWSPKGKASPELRLFFMLTASAVSIQLHKGCDKLLSGMGSNKNTGQTSSAGGATTALNENPGLLKELRDKATGNPVGDKKQQYQQNEEEKINNNLREQKLLREKQEEWMRIQEMATKNDVMNKLQNDLLMSESAKSTGNAFAPIDTNIINSNSRQNFNPNIFQHQQQQHQQQFMMNERRPGATGIPINQSQQQKYAAFQPLRENIIQQPAQQQTNAAIMQQKRQQLSEVNKMLDSMRDRNPRRDTDSQSSLSINPRASEVLRNVVKKPKKGNKQQSDTSDDDLYKESLSIGSRISH